MNNAPDNTPSPSAKTTRANHAPSRCNASSTHASTAANHTIEAPKVQKELATAHAMDATKNPAKIVA
ncbi:hypothetical protein [Streptomyces lydicus]|uniref:hypothetical protein n=1 Tax=Streptomyces lydicus TaxID=47763 RepID=UPI0036DFCBD2